MPALTIEWTWIPVLIALCVIIGALFGRRYGVGAAVLMLMQAVLLQFIDQGSGWASDAVLVASVMVASLIWNPAPKGRRPRQVGMFAAVAALFVVALHLV